MKRYKEGILLIFLFLATLDFMSAAFQGDNGQLVITEVCLDAQNRQIWVEVFNPENVPVILESLRIADIRRPNALAPEIRRQQGFKIEPRERIVLCSDLESFRETYGDGIRTIEQTNLSSVLMGGFLVINHIHDIENSMNTVRLGEAEKSLLVSSNVPDDQAVMPVYDGSSYQRELLPNSELSSWSKQVPTPGN